MLDIPLLPNQKTMSTWEISTSQISVGKATVWVASNPETPGVF